PKTAVASLAASMSSSRTRRMSRSSASRLARTGATASFTAAPTSLRKTVRAGRTAFARRRFAVVIGRSLRVRMQSGTWDTGGPVYVRLTRIHVKKETDVSLHIPGDPLPLSLAGPLADAGVMGEIEHSGGSYEPHVVRALGRLIGRDAVVFHARAAIRLH